MNGTDVKVERVRRKVKQYRLAAALGITQSELCAVENGRKPITHDRAITIRNVIRELAAQRQMVISRERVA
ncbi:MAG: hypothetical protein ACRDJW_04590 [Thermomicrobiales bacterium]